jgi:hypothetical protein
MHIITHPELVSLIGKEKADAFLEKQKVVGSFRPIHDAVLVEPIPEESVLELKEAEVRKVRVLDKGNEVSDAVEIGKVYLIETSRNFIKRVKYKGETLAFIHQDYLLGTIC